MGKSKKVVPTSLSFVDIAGLVKGASKGEGLGNQFLANIRECDAIVHVVRCFEDENIIHVDGSVDPIRDIEVISLELIFADMAQVEKRLERVKKDLKKGGEAAATEEAALEKVLPALLDGVPARKVELSEDESKSIQGLGLLSQKRVIYAANVVDEDLSDGNPMVTKVAELAKKEGASIVTVSAQVEAELVESLGVEDGQSGLDKLIREVYNLLQLRTYYTSGETETKAWTIRAGMLAPQAAGVIHTDFEKGFIRAETVSYDDLSEQGSMSAAKDAGLVRSEGKEYEVKDGDVMLFRFNV